MGEPFSDDTKTGKTISYKAWVASASSVGLRGR